MDKTHTFLKPYIDRLVEKGRRLPNIGLWDGKMGIAISLFHISKIVNDEKYENEANELLNAVCEQVSNTMPLSFDDGLMGIGCGIEYLISNELAEGDSDEILQEMDLIARNLINMRTIDVLNLEKGVCGIGYYLYCRLKKRADSDDNIIVLRLKEYLIYLIDWMESLILKKADKSDYNDAYFLLTRLYQLGVYNYKVERLMALCLQKMIDYNCLATDSYELLGLDSLKVLKSWI